MCRLREGCDCFPSHEIITGATEAKTCDRFDQAVWIM
jgi:hypothetical protein